MSLTDNVKTGWDSQKKIAVAAFKGGDETVKASHAGRLQLAAALIFASLGYAGGISRAAKVNKRGRIPTMFGSKEARVTLDARDGKARVSSIEVRKGDAPAVVMNDVVAGLLQGAADPNVQFK